MSTTKGEAESANRTHSVEVAPVHLESCGIEGLLGGCLPDRRYPEEGALSEADKDLIHLQCHIGTDILSLALDGGKVTDADFSPESLWAAAVEAWLRDDPA
jgi:hypothetical protein